jgi:hypothetical protein
MRMPLGDSKPIKCWLCSGRPPRYNVANAKPHHWAQSLASCICHKLSNSKEIVPFDFCFTTRVLSEGYTVQAGWSRVRFPVRSLNFFCVNLPNASNGTMAWGCLRIRKYFWAVERGQRVRLTVLPPSVSRLSKQYGIFNISQPYRPPRPLTPPELSSQRLVASSFHFADHTRFPV